jgi:ribosome-binding factor A
MEAGFEHLRDALAETFAAEVEFPRGSFVTVLDTKMTQNTLHVRVTISVFPESMQADVLDALTRQSHAIKDGLARRLRLRRIPNLHYVFDTTEATAAGVESALHHLKKEGEL